MSNENASKQVPIHQRPLPDDEIYRAKELCVQMGECSATYYIVLLISEVERLRAFNGEVLDALKIMVASAVPHPTEHPTMTKAWGIANTVIAKAGGEIND